jgi:aspartyl protease family protein
MHKAKKYARNTIFLVAACALSTWVAAQSVALSGVLGSKALLIVDGTSPKAVATGESHLGVKVISVNGEQAVLDIKGQRSTLRIGDAPVSVGTNRYSSSVSGNKIVLPIGQGGHFFAQAVINGVTMPFMVDTGATAVAMGQSDAQRMGIDYKKGRPVQMGTANGVAQGWLVRLRSVRIGDVEVFEVDAVVGPNMPTGLLGNSFLNRFNMNRTSDMMVLERRY